MSDGAGETVWHGNGKVLVVDDEASVRTVASALLRRRGFAVEESPDGADAVARFREAPADWCLVLLDLSMPVLAGDRAMRAMREVRPNLPILIMSGHDPLDVRRQVGEGVAFVQKPFKSAELIGTIRTMLAE